MCPSFTELRLFFHKVFFIINTLFHTCMTCCLTATSEIFAETSEIFTHAVFQLVVIAKTGVIAVRLSGGQKDGSQNVVLRCCREGEGEEVEGEV
jgi:hypothetical protein